MERKVYSNMKSVEEQKVYMKRIEQIEQKA